MLDTDRFSLNDKLDVLVIHRGGCGGNFIADLVNKYVFGVDGTTNTTEMNEYILTPSTEHKAVPMHLHLFFQDVPQDQTIVPLADLRELINMFNQYVKKIVFVGNKIDPDWTTGLRDVKHGFEIPARRRTPINSAVSDFYQKIYNNFLLKHYTGDLLYLEYQDFFVHGKTHTLVDFFRSRRHNDINTDVTDYHNKNVEIMKSFGWKWNKHA